MYTAYSSSYISPKVHNFVCPDFLCVKRVLNKAEVHLQELKQKNPQILPGWKKINSKTLQ